MFPTPPDLRYSKETLSSHSIVLCYPHTLYYMFFFHAGIRRADEGGGRFRLRGISEPGGPLQSGFSAQTQR